MRVDAEVRFSIVPEWVIYAQVSSHAVRLYAVLARYANESRQCSPGRKRLADHMGVSVSTMDRALDELVQLGAVTVTRQKDQAGDWASNLYVLGVVSPVTTPLVTGDQTVVAPVTTKREPVEREQELSFNEHDDPAFDEFWKAYPRRIGKGHAKKAWAGALKRGANPAELVKAATDFGQTVNGSDPRFVPHPSTWLNGERYADEVELPPDPHKAWWHN